MGVASGQTDKGQSVLHASSSELSRIISLIKTRIVSSLVAPSRDSTLNEWGRDSPNNSIDSIGHVKVSSAS